MKIQRHDFEALLREAVRAGSNGQDREAFFSELTKRFALTEDNFDTEFRIYSIEELREVKPGSVFEHSKYGLCRFDIHDGDMVGFFDSPILAFGMLSVGNKPPWDKPMRRVDPARWTG